MKEIILVKYGEIALKGLNKSTFEDMLQKNIKRRLKKLEAERAARAAEEKKAALELAKKLEKLEITVSAHTTDGKRLYGAVSVTDILAAIEANRGVKVERHQLELDDALKEVGVYEPTIDLGRGVTVKFKITILDEEAPEAVLIAGDVYDKSVPSAEAVRLLDDFLVELSRRPLQTCLISGNHDSPVFYFIFEQIGYRYIIFV